MPLGYVGPMTETAATSQNLSDALTSELEKTRAEALAFRIEETKEAFAYFYGKDAAEVLRYENADAGYVKVSTDAAGFFVMAGSDFDETDCEFYTLRFYTTIPTNVFTRHFTKVKRSTAMASLAGKVA
jgi:hypothetical protein